MAFTLDEIVPWGRNFAEYAGMFALTGRDLGGGIVGCGDGPASFNAEATLRGHRVVSCDPLYAFPGSAIAARIEATWERVMAQLRANLGNYRWEVFASADEVGHARMTAMRAFLADYDEGRAAGRYLAAPLPALPFPDRHFGLALCSHLLFLYSDHLDRDFHVAAIAEMCRVAGEARIFPLVTIDAKPSAHVAPVAAALAETGHRVEIERVPYEFQKGADRMMRVWRS